MQDTTIVADNMTVNQLGTINQLATLQQTGTVTTIATGNTININNLGVVRVTTAGAVTGVILQAGTKAGQQVIVIHEGAAANTITFAASGTSNVADGTSAVITGPAQKMFVWDSVTSLWYHN